MNQKIQEILSEHQGCGVNVWFKNCDKDYESGVISKITDSFLILKAKSNINSQQEVTTYIELSSIRSFAFFAPDIYDRDGIYIKN